MSSDEPLISPADKVSGSQLRRHFCMPLSYIPSFCQILPRVALGNGDLILCSFNPRCLDPFSDRLFARFHLDQTALVAPARE